MRQVTIKEVEEIAFILAKKHLAWDEPIPDFSTRYPGVLESCLKNAWQTFNKRDLYPRLTDKAAIIFYQIIKNHPFLNGNKRIAVTTLWVFYYLNNRWLIATNEEIYQLAVLVAESSPKSKDLVVSTIKEFVSKHKTVISD